MRSAARATTAFDRSSRFSAREIVALFCSTWRRAGMLSSVRRARRTRRGRRARSRGRRFPREDEQLVVAVERVAKVFQCRMPSLARTKSLEDLCVEEMSTAFALGAPITHEAMTGPLVTPANPLRVLASSRGSIATRRWAGKLDETSFDDVVGIHPDAFHRLDPRRLVSLGPPLDLGLSVALAGLDVALLTVRQPQLDERAHTGKHIRVFRPLVLRPLRPRRNWT